MRICHQMCLIKWNLKYRKLDGETAAFLKELLSIHKGIYEASRKTDEGVRLAEADRLDAELAALMERQWGDKDGNIERYRKRYRRESGFLTVCLRVPGVPPDNDPVERSNRKVVAARSDGGGNRSGKWMEANSILFTNMVTDWLAGKSFFDHMVLAASGDRQAGAATGWKSEKPQGRRRLRTTCGPSMRMRSPANIASKSKAITNFWTRPATGKRIHKRHNTDHVICTAARETTSRKSRSVTQTRGKNTTTCRYGHGHPATTLFPRTSAKPV